ncbi:hypothetical protein DPMN_110210 [Dreissena polymorpha]|uniref:Uncharacterized protein n=1 Tax=Dreissena polymorpha TaxID=45954 RepID=A0A9D4QMW9_DREPO|nr:hypothetical protein DPMN_110210 [Dreissena polymorpha]
MDVIFGTTTSNSILRSQTEYCYYSECSSYSVLSVACLRGAVSSESALREQSFGSSQVRDWGNRSLTIRKCESMLLGNGSEWNGANHNFNWHVKIESETGWVYGYLPTNSYATYNSKAICFN